MNQADLIILGAGPAGTSAAITAAQASLRVVLIESLQFPRHRPGETLHPGVEPLLRQLGVGEEILDADFVRHEGHFVKWNGAKKFTQFGRDENGLWQGFQAWRSDFDTILLNRARNLGVKVYQPCRAISPLIKENAVVGIRTSKGDLYGKFLVDAAGGRHWLAKHLNIKIASFTPRLIVRYGYVWGGDIHLCNETPSLVADKRGWTWTAEVRPGMFHLSRLVFCESTGTERLFSKKNQNLFREKAIRGADVTWRVAARSAGDGYFLSGDAASVLDPVSSHGVLKALMSGIMTGYLIAQVKLNKLSGAQASKVYNRWVLDWFFNDAQKLIRLYQELLYPPLWLPQTGNQLSEENNSRLQL